MDEDTYREIRDELKRNKRVGFVKEFFAQNACSVKSLKFYVSPSGGPLHRVRDLWTFLDDVVPNAEEHGNLEISKTDFRNLGDTIFFGHLCLQDRISEQQWPDTDAIWIYPMPSRMYLEGCLAGRMHRGVVDITVLRTYLADYKPNFFDRLKASYHYLRTGSLKD